MDQVLKGSEAGFTNVSTAFVGKNEIPFVSYTKVGSESVFMAFPATTGFPGNCGLNNGWHCTYYLDYNLAPTSLSNVATDQYGPDTFGVKWVYKDLGVLKVLTREYTNDMKTLLTQNTQDMVQLSKFGGVLVGAPSIYQDGLWLRMAVVIRDNTDLYGYKLIYVHYAGNTPTNSCTDAPAGSVYECDVIESGLGFGLIGSPSIDLAPNGTVGIAYYFGGAVKYAYPYLGALANCGPGGNSWLCITITKPSLGTIGPVVKFDFGSAATDRGIVYTYKDTTNTYIRHAEYLGSNDGDCGLVVPIGYYWKCTDVVNLGQIATSWTPSFHVAVDPQGYSVISYNRNPDFQSPLVLYLAYPRARAGLIGPGWVSQYIEGGPVNDVDTGELTDVSLNSAGYGFMAYLKQLQGPGELPDLKIALQARQLFLPITLK
jgi:hypothetical protein